MPPPAVDRIPQPVGAPRPIAALPAGTDVATVAITADGAVAQPDGEGVTVFESGGRPVASIAGGSAPIWSPLGGVLLLATSDDAGGTTAAFWDRQQGELFVPAGSEIAVPHRDLPLGWVGPVAYYQRVFLDGSDRVELRAVSAVSGEPAETVWSGAGGPFGGAVTAGRISPAGDRLAFVADRQLYVAATSDPAGTGTLLGGGGTSLAGPPPATASPLVDGFSLTIHALSGAPAATLADADGAPSVPPFGGRKGSTRRAAGIPSASYCCLLGPFSPDPSS
jgi:hypothetical protein